MDFSANNFWLVIVITASWKFDRLCISYAFLDLIGVHYKSDHPVRGCLKCGQVGFQKIANVVCMSREVLLTIEKR